MPISNSIPLNTLMLGQIQDKVVTTGLELILNIRQEASSILMLKLLLIEGSSKVLVLVV
jgi:hypothetical protein